MKLAIYLVFAMTLCSAWSQTTSGSGSRQRSSMADKYIAKGGVGIISTNLYVDTQSRKNELILGNSGRWVGHQAADREVVMFFDGHVFAQQDIPKNFNLSHAIMVSFEGEVVKFFDFATESGGYYDRLSK